MAKITIYSTETCAFCKMLKSYLQQNNISYDEKYVDQDSKLAEELLEQSGQMGVPFTIIQKDDGEEVKIVGFDRPKVDAALGL